MRVFLTSRRAAVMLCFSVAFAAGACGPTDGVPNILIRTIPDPLRRSEADISNDSLVLSRWTTRTEIPDPLADAEGSSRIRLEAILYGEDVIAATVVEQCGGDSIVDEGCREQKRNEYDAGHMPDSLFRIRLDLQSTFSVNSLHPKFWDIYVKDEQDIAHEPVKIEMQEPVIVREDSLPEPGRAAVRAGLYRRTVDLYFPISTPFGIRTIGPEAKRVRLIISRDRKEVADLLWQIERGGAPSSPSSRKRRVGGSTLDF